MSIRSHGIAGSIAALTLACACAPALASKPTHAASPNSVKIDPRGGPPSQVGPGVRPGFSDSRVRRQTERDDGRGDRHGDRNDRWDDDRRDGDWRRDDDRHDRWDGDDHRRHDDRYYYTTRHAYPYPRPGYVVYRLPPRHRVAHYHGSPYYYGGGAWYQPWGSSFVVVAPPIGLAVSFLPDVYTTVWIGGLQYYRANDTYYRWHSERRAYVVTGFPHGVH